MNRKRKIADESRVFQEKWTNLYLFVNIKEKPVCLVCRENLAVMKEYNLKRHYETKHAAKFDGIEGQMRVDKVEALKKQLQLQQYTFQRPNIESEACLKVSYIVSEKIASKSKPFVDGEFIKECMESAAEVLCPSQKHLFSKISLSGVTVARRVEELSEDIENSFKSRASKFVFYSVAIDESVDMTDTAQLAIFIRGINDNFEITEELAALYPIKGTTKGADIFKCVMMVLNRYNIDLTKLSGIITDGAPAMVGVTDMAMLSRPVCGIKNKTIIINFPGSAKAAVECFGFIKNSLLHAVALVTEQDTKVKQLHEHLQNPQKDYTSVSGESKVKIKAWSRLRKSEYPMTEVYDAKNIIFNAIAVSEETEIIPIESSLTRILAEDIKAAEPVPAFRASIKDGYAVRAGDGFGQRRVRSVTAAGDQPEVMELQPGEVIRISTGAPIPPGADAVVQVEDTTLAVATANGEEEEFVNIDITPKVGQDIREIGSDIQANTVVLEKHNPITAAYIGVLAMLGFRAVKIIRRPSVGVISTGNELENSNEPLKPGKIYDSNKLTLLALLESYGYTATDCGIARDTPNSVKSTLEKALELNDLIISSGGVSMGEYDLLKQVLVTDFEATIQFGRVNMKPGKPTVFATLKFKGLNKVIFALPGNPVSCCVTSLLFVIPTLRHMEGNRQFKGWPIVRVIVEHDIVNRDTRPEYVRLCVVTDKNNRLVATSTGNQISSRLNSMVNANGLLPIPGKTTFERGSAVPVYLFGQL